MKQHFPVPADNWTMGFFTTRPIQVSPLVLRAHQLIPTHANYTLWEAGRIFQSYPSYVLDDLLKGGEHASCSRSPRAERIEGPDIARAAVLLQKRLIEGLDPRDDETPCFVEIAGLLTTWIDGGAKDLESAQPVFDRIARMMKEASAQVYCPENQWAAWVVQRIGWRLGSSHSSNPLARARLVNRAFEIYPDGAALVLLEETRKWFEAPPATQKRSCWGKVVQATLTGLEARHRIDVKNTFEVEHEGVRYTVGRTNKGLLMLFPNAEGVEIQDVVEMMNRTNRPDSFGKRPMEWCGTAEPLSDRVTFNRTIARVSGTYEIQGKQPQARLEVWRKVEKPVPDANSPLEEALLLQRAAQQGLKCERPVAVFLGGGRFPEMIFTTHIKGKVEPIRDCPLYGKPRRLPVPEGPIVDLFEDAVLTSDGEWVLIDAQFRDPETSRSTQRLRRKIRWS